MPPCHVLKNDDKNDKVIVSFDMLLNESEIIG